MVSTVIACLAKAETGVFQPRYFGACSLPQDNSEQARQKTGFPLQFLDPPYGGSAGFPLQSLARPSGEQQPEGLRPAPCAAFGRAAT
jgi:hypothetical protein